MLQFVSKLMGVVLLMISFVGCSSITESNKTVLKPAQKNPDSIPLEIMFVRLPKAQLSQYSDLWATVDEQQVSAEVRQKIAKNGFRLGIVGGQLPPHLQKHFSKEKQADNKTTDTSTQQIKLDETPEVVGRKLQLRSGKNGEIQVSDVYDSLPILMPSEGQLQGQTYQKAQGIFQLTATRTKAGKVKLELTPEIQHGEPSNRYTQSQEGVWMMHAGRERERFSELKTSVLLDAGQMLLISCAPERSGSLGSNFFMTNSNGEQEQKLLFIRLTQPYSEDLTLAKP